MCVLGYMKYLNKVGRICFYFVKSFYKGKSGKQYGQNREILWKSPKMALKIGSGAKI